MVNILKKTFHETIQQFTQKKTAFLYFFFISIFGAWNGIQFLSYPKHFNAFVNSTTVEVFFYDLFKRFATFIPSTVFVFITIGFICWFLHIRAEIAMIDYCKKKMSPKEKRSLFFNFSIPSFFTHLLALFLTVTLILLLIIIYLLLISFGLKFSLSALTLFWVFIKFMIAIVIMTSFVLNDFVLYFQYIGNSYMLSVKKTYKMIKEKSYNFLLYLFYKGVSIILSIVFLLFFLKIYVFAINNIATINAMYHKIYILKLMTNNYDVFINMLLLFIGIILSSLVFAISISFLFPFNRLLIWNLFDFEKENEGESDDNNVLL